MVMLYGPPEEPDAFARHYADTPNDGILASWSCWTSTGDGNGGRGVR